MHTEWTDRLTAYLDDELDSRERQRVEAHLAGCAECRVVLAELRRVVRWAHEYEGEMPRADLWPGVRARIEADRVVAMPGRRPAERRFGWRHLIAAGLVMGVGGAGGAWLATRSAIAPSAPVVAVEAPAVAAVAATPEELAIRDLEELLAVGRTRLDTATVRVVEQSLLLIDGAIAEARRAIQRDSTNAYLNGRIAAHMRQKLAILRMATRAYGAES